jgi:hypothetical protein
VFKITIGGGLETMVYPFQGGLNDGAEPGASLTKRGVVLWGTTIQGGANGNGTVFSIP